MGIILFISGQEIFVIMIVVLLLFGADKLPEFAKAVGKGMRDFKKASDDIRREIETSTRDIRNEFNDIQNSVRQEVNDISDNIQKNISDTTGSIKADFQEAADDFQKNVNDMNQTAESMASEFDYTYGDYPGYSESGYMDNEPPSAGTDNTAAPANADSEASAGAAPGETPDNKIVNPSDNNQKPSENDDVNQS